MQELQESIIEMSKQLIIINNRIVQQSAKYNYLKNSLISQNFCPETLPRPNVIKRKPKTQTIGLPKLFGGTLDLYYEATGEIIPLVLESCVKYINTFGMKHHGIFRIGGAHVSLDKYLGSKCFHTAFLGGYYQVRGGFREQRRSLQCDGQRQPRQLCLWGPQELLQETGGGALQ